jgi:hypothetical protein
MENNGAVIRINHLTAPFSYISKKMRIFEFNKNSSFSYGVLLGTVKMNKYSELQNSRIMLPHWEKWITSLTNQIGNSYFLSFMFHNLPGKTSTKLDIMRKDIDRFYNKLLTRALRYPRSELHLHKRPLLFASPDLPVFKHIKDNHQAITVNGGLHIHAVVIIPPGTRFKRALQYHLAEKDQQYRSGTAIRTIDVQPIKKTPGKVAQYLFKAIGKHFDESRILVQPGPRPKRKHGG